MATEVDPRLEGPPGTTETRQLETVDDDLLGPVSVLGSEPGPPATPRPTPGTTYTFSIETIDNDLVGALGMVDPDAPRPRPNPGTRVTATIETMDEHQSVTLSLHDG